MDNIITREGRYQIAKAQPNGASVECPHCGTQFTKASHQQAFCSNKGPGNCKDAYWNSRGPRSRAGQQVDAAAELRELIRLALPFVSEGIEARAKALVEQPLTATETLNRRNELERSYDLSNRMVKVLL